MEWLCRPGHSLAEARRACQQLRFAQKPLIRGFGGVTGDASVPGPATDNVKRIVIMLETRKRLSAPIVDNAFLLCVPPRVNTGLLIAHNGAGKTTENKSF